MSDDPTSNDSTSGDSANGELSRVVRTVLHSGDPLGVSDPGRDRPADRCERCGGADEELVMMIAPHGGAVRVHQVCGDLCRCTLTPPCTRAPDPCGAPVGRPCAQGCPSLATGPTRRRLRPRAPDPDRNRAGDRCERCLGGGELALMTAPNGELVRVHPTCGDLCRCTPIPPCTGALDLCGAPAGQPCAPGCPGLADDPNRSDPRLTNG